MKAFVAVASDCLMSFIVTLVSVPLVVTLIRFGEACAGGGQLRQGASLNAVAEQGASLPHAPAVLCVQRAPGRYLPLS